LYAARQKAQSGKPGGGLAQTISEVSDVSLLFALHLPFDLDPRPKPAAPDGEQADRRSRDTAAEFETVSRLVKMEFARFERERVDEFKRVMERHLEGQIKRQAEMVGAWEEYHAVVLRMVEKSA
jgi:hypothetical protein